MSGSATAMRVLEEMDRIKVDQSELARRVGCTPAAINQIVKGKTTNSRFIPRIAAEFGVSLAWLLGMSDDPGDGAALVANNDDDVQIDLLHDGFGMGGTYLDDNSVEVEKVTMSRRVLAHYTTAPPDLLGIARGIGDSMEPTINDRDDVIFDRGDTDVRPGKFGDKIWAFNFGGVGMVKRLRPKTDGTIEILSDNPVVPPDRATDGELYIIGRVVAVMKKV